VYLCWIYSSLLINLFFHLIKFFINLSTKKGCSLLNCLNGGACIGKTETKEAYCDCSGIGFNGPLCENDINECEINNGGCSEQATCKNIEGGFECTCKDGYSGDGISCNPAPSSPSDKDESNQTTGIGIGVGVGAGILALLLLALLILFFLRRKVIKKEEKEK